MLTAQAAAQAAASAAENNQMNLFDKYNKLEQAYEAGRRQDLNEQTTNLNEQQTPSPQQPWYYGTPFIETLYLIQWLLSQGIIDSATFLKWYDAVAAGTADFMDIYNYYGEQLYNIEGTPWLPPTALGYYDWRETRPAINPENPSTVSKHPTTQK